MDVRSGGRLADASVEFWRDPERFWRRRTDANGSPFAARLLGNDTLFVTAHAHVRQLLCDGESAFRPGYVDYFGPLFGSASLFLHDGPAGCQRAAVQRALADSAAVDGALRAVPTIVRAYVGRNVDFGRPVCSYGLFKAVVSRCMIYALLGVGGDGHSDGAEVRRIGRLCTAHWHGIISVPVSVRLPFNVASSGYERALGARSELLECCTRAAACPPAGARCGGPLSLAAGTPNAGDELVLLLCALIPKAAASLCATLALYCSRWTECFSLPLAGGAVDVTALDDTQLDAVLSELCRLRPPFYGGRRVAIHDTEVAGVRVSRHRPVVYISGPAHRDPAVFDRPDVFDPRRWMRPECVGGAADLFAFGGGPRACVGRSLALPLIKCVLRELCAAYDVRLADGDAQPEAVPYKHLPVSRPKQPVYIVLAEKYSSV